MSSLRQLLSQGLSVLCPVPGTDLNLHHEQEIWGVTAELRMRFKKPIPLNEELKVVGRITKESNRLFEGSGELILQNGDIAVTCEGKIEMKSPPVHSQLHVW